MGQLLVIASIVLFGAAATASFEQWRSDGSRSMKWVGLAFLSLALVELQSALEAWDVIGDSAWIQRGTVGVVALFPFFLYRFARSFTTFPKTIDIAAFGITAAIAIGGLVMPIEPDAASSRPVWMILFLVGLALQWTLLSGLTVGRLWQVSFDAPAVTRRRMRLTASALVGLNVGVLLAVVPSSGTFETVVELIVLFSAACFYIATSPPLALREMWRRPEQRALQEAMHGLMAATNRADVAQILLPHAVATLGARGALIRDSAGDVIETCGPEAPSDSSFERVELGDGIGTLEIWTNSLKPFFGHDEKALLTAIATLAGLAMQRVELFEQESVARSTMEGFNKKLKSRNEELFKEIAERQNAEAELIIAREQAEHANHAKSEFLSRMSHELRTPLNSILGFGQLLQMDEPDGERRENVDYILKAGKHLLDLINEILDISRIEAGKMTLSLEPICVEESISEVVNLVQPLARRSRIELRVGNTPDESVHVLADRQRLKQVLINLLSNGVKYNREEGKVVISATEMPTGRVQIMVEDTGYGIAPDQLQNLYEPFDRLGADATTVEGTGLGLALSKRLVEVMGGQIAVSSEIDLGTIFSVEFPIAEAPEGTAFEVVPDAVEDLHTGRAQTVLYIEDNLSNLKLVERLVARRGGIELITAVEAKQGLILARKHLPDVILLDLHLPDMTGEQALREVRRDPTTREIPVVVVSADATSNQRKQLLKAGADDYLTKPISVERFAKMLDERLREAVA